jgi:hypothetical protein
VTSDSPNPQAALRIVRGTPTLEELAALTAVIGAAGEATPVNTPRPEPARGRWNDPAFGHRRYWPVGIGGWRHAL